MLPRTFSVIVSLPLELSDDSVLFVFLKESELNAVLLFVALPLPLLDALRDMLLVLS